jgi:uncharacterized protein (TIGR02285 family)
MVRLLLAGLLLLVAGATRAQDPRVITWNLSDWPPFYVLKDGQAPASAAQLGDGAIDEFLRLLLPLLPDYEHRFVTLNAPRAEVQRKTGLGLCSPSSMRTPARLQERYFTPALPTVQLQLVLRRERLAVLAQGRGSVSLRELGERADLSGLVMKGRHYGEGLAPWLVEAPGRNLRTMVAPRAGNLLTMLAAGRMDYTVEYPMVVAYHQQGRAAELVSLPIDEAGEPPLGYISCNRNAWGLAVMRDIDRALRQLARQPEAAQVYRRWLGEEQQAREQARLARFFAQRARGGVRIE